MLNTNQHYTRNDLRKDGASMNISKRKIEAIQARKQLTQAAVADSVGVTRQALSKALRRGNCTPITAGKIAAALGVDVTELMED